MALLGGTRGLLTTRGRWIGRGLVGHTNPNHWECQQMTPLKKRANSTTSSSSLLSQVLSSSSATTSVSPTLPPHIMGLGGTSSFVLGSCYGNSTAGAKKKGPRQVVSDLPIRGQIPRLETFHIPKKEQDFWTWVQGGYTRGITAMKKSIHVYRDMNKQIHHPYFYQMYQTDEYEIEQWFSLAVFHFWMTSVVLRGIEGRDAVQYNKGIYEMFWNELEERILDGGVRDVWGTSFIIDRRLKQYLNVYLGIMLALDEGLVRGDTVLAEAIWRNVLIGDHHTSQTAEFLVQYARQQIATIKKHEDMFMYHAHICWVNLDGYSPVMNEALRK
mmetsp:Transcript_20026/g.31376  ORF Transcript_20026/g.31376 Transcript_20026/m.31376 type:complete len:328 (-) Transcript_20026:4-987(-)